MSYEVLRYRPELRAGVIALQQHLVSADPVLNDAYFRWKHEDNPYTAEPVAYVAVSGSKVAGMRAFQGARWHLGVSGETATWLCACDMVVDPAHRGAKLFRRIMDFALADLAEREPAPTLNWSASPITYGASLRSGWQLIAPFVPRARETPRARVIRALGRRMRRWPIAWRLSDLRDSLALRSGFDALDAAWSNREANAALSIAREPRPEEMDRLVRMTGTQLIRHERDTTYYRWRFRNPLCSYRFLFWSDPDVRAFLVLQVSRRRKAADISIVDWEAATPELVDAMLSALVAVGGYDRLSIWTATLPADITASLAGRGFASVDDTRGNPDYRPGLLAIGPAGSDLRTPGAVYDRAFSLPGRWDIRMAYSDFY